MTDHLPECPVPAMEAGHGPLHPEDAEANCICDELRSFEQRVLEAARAAVLAYADDTHQHTGMLKCWPENGDRCDITAALRVAAQRIDDLREDTK